MFSREGTALEDPQYLMKNKTLEYIQDAVAEYFGVK